VRKRTQVQFLCSSFRVSERRACGVLKLQRSVYQYRHRRDPQTELRIRLKELAAARVRYGYERLHTLLVREGWRMRVYIPFGTEWYPYFMRRLAERPANAFFLARNLFR